MTDAEAIQGLWRIVRCTMSGHHATHEVFEGNTWREIDPNFVDDGTLRVTYELDESADPKRIRRILDWNGPDGPPDPNAYVEMGLYVLEGDRLELHWGNDGYPRDLNDDQATVVVLERDRGPIPQTRQPSGTPSIEDEVLGRLVWNDNIRWYEGGVSFGNRTIEISLKTDDHGEVAQSLARARQVVRKLSDFATRAKTFATQNLLNLKNWEWRGEDESEVTPQEFKSRMTLESITFDPDGRVTFWHDDDDLFCRHSIEIRLNARDEFDHAGIAG